MPIKGDSVRLTELWPDQIDTAREPLRINRSLNDKPPAIGRKHQLFGLRQWIESAVSYNKRGRFRRFRTKFGIGAEGAETISPDRKYAENPTFLVLGDGRLLAEKGNVRFGDTVHSFDVNITGVERLSLVVLRNYEAGWLYGAICWGEPALVR